MDELPENKVKLLPKTAAVIEELKKKAVIEELKLQVIAQNPYQGLMVPVTERPKKKSKLGRSIDAEWLPQWSE